MIIDKVKKEAIWQSARKKFIKSFSKPIKVKKIKIDRRPGMPDPFASITQKDREKAWRRGSII